MALIFLYKRCKFGKKICNNSRDIKFFLGDYFFGVPCILLLLLLLLFLLSLCGNCCRTKIQLANEIDDYTKKLLEDYEDLDKLSIQADIWHSKYKASRSVNMYNRQ